MKTKTVNIFGLKNELNYGDGIILDCTKHLFLNTDKTLDVKILDIFYDRKPSKLDRFLERVISRHKKNNIYNKLIVFALWNLMPNGRNKLQKYLKKNVGKNSLVVFAGGGIIKYKGQNFSNEVYQILKYCETRKIPVFFNSVGVEGYDKTMLSSRRFKKALNLCCVKLLSTRDALELLKKYRPGFPCHQVCDPGVWVNTAYGIEKKPSDVVGIGLIRENIFIDYGVEITPEQLLDFYCELVKLLKINDVKFEFFTNGLNSDGVIIEKINQRLNENYVVHRPTSEKNLVEIVSNYCFTITSRLHASIVSYALKIPNIALVWNNKIKYFCDLTDDCHFTYVEGESFAAKYVYKKYLELKDGVVKDNHAFKNSILENIDFILGYKENK